MLVGCRRPLTVLMCAGCGDKDQPGDALAAQDLLLAHQGSGRDAGGHTGPFVTFWPHGLHLSIITPLATAEWGGSLLQCMLPENFADTLRASHEEAAQDAKPARIQHP